MDKYFWLKIVLNCFELAAFLAGVFYWNKVRNTYWKYFVFYLGIVFFTEMLAKYVGYGLGNAELNAGIYFFFGVPVQFVFWPWLFYKWFANRKEKLIPIIGIILYALAWVVDLLFFKEERMWFSSFSYLVGNFILFFILVMFFLRFANSNEIIGYRNSMIFWVSIGMLIFYIPSLPFFGLRNFWYYKHPEIFYPYWSVTYVLGCLMYLLFVFAFVWKKQK